MYLFLEANRDFPDAAFYYTLQWYHILCVFVGVEGCYCLVLLSLALLVYSSSGSESVQITLTGHGRSPGG